MESWEIVAREEIRATLSRYTWCGDFGDADGFVELFTDDGVLEVKGQRRYQGHDQIRGMVQGAGSGGESQPVASAETFRGPLRHHVSSIRIEFDSRELANAWAYFLVTGRDGPDHWGRYTDELVASGGRWLFRSRRASIDGAAPGTRWATSKS